MIRSMGLDAKKSGVNVLPWLWQVSGLYKIGIAALFILQVVFGICGVVSAMLFRTLIDAAVDGGRSGFFMAGLLLLPRFFGAEATFFSEPIADVIAAAMSSILFLRAYPKVLQTCASFRQGAETAVQ